MCFVPAFEYSLDGFTDYLNVGCHVNNIMHRMFLLKSRLSFVHMRTHKMVAVYQYLQSTTCTQSIMRSAITMLRLVWMQRVKDSIFRYRDAMILRTCGVTFATLPVINSLSISRP